MRLQGQQFRQFRDAVLGAFSPSEFDDMLLFQLNIRRSNIALGGTQQEIVLKVIQAVGPSGLGREAVGSGTRCKSWES